MKKILIHSFIVSLAMMLSISCKKSFVEISPEGQFLTENYYKDEGQAYSALIAAYDVMRKNSGGFENMITMLNAGSDDHFAGGGNSSDGAGIQSFSNFTINATTVPGSYWNDHYQGVFRSNVLLIKIPNTPMDQGKKDRFIAEVKALRALYYFNLVRLFKNVPLILEPITTAGIYQVTQAAPADVYTQIEKDLTDALGSLPATKQEGGRLTKAAAQALLGKVYLYQNKNQQAASILAEVNGTTPGGVNQYGHRLLSNFSDLWVVANKFNDESLIEVNHTNKVSLGDWGLWGSSRDESNTVNQMVGPRSYTRVGTTAPDLPSGWSFNPITQDLYDLIKPDPRFAATVLDMKALKAAGQVDYLEAHQNTGYFLNKFIPRRVDVAPAGSPELNYQQNTYVIRLADTYLLEAEALGGTGARAQALLDAVRARVGLASVPVSLTAIKRERRLELAGEGHRFFDLVRWGDAPAVLGSRGFVAGKNEIFPIPVAELQGTLIKQNPNYN